MSNKQSSSTNEKLYKEAGIDYKAIKEKRKKRGEIRRKIRNSNRRQHHEMNSRGLLFSNILPIFNNMWQRLYTVPKELFDSIIRMIWIFNCFAFGFIIGLLEKFTWIIRMIGSVVILIYGFIIGLLRKPFKLYQESKVMEKDIIMGECSIQHEDNNGTTREEDCQIHTEKIYVRSSYRKKLTGKQGRKKKNLINESGVKDIVVGTSIIDGFRDNYVSVQLTGSREGIEKALSLIQSTIGDNWYNSVFNFEDNEPTSSTLYQSRTTSTSVLENVPSQSNENIEETQAQLRAEKIVNEIIDRGREPLVQLKKATEQPTSEEKKHLTKEELWPYFAFNGALLSSSPPDTRNRIIDEHFYPLINQPHSNQFTRVIMNMLHNIDVPDLLRLYESPEALNAKIQETVELYKEQEKENLQEEVVPTLGQHHSPKECENNCTQSRITMAYVPPHRRGKKNITGNGGSLNELAKRSTNHIPANDGNELTERSGSKASEEFSFDMNENDPLLLFLKSQHTCITGNVDEFYTWLVKSEDIGSMAALKEAVSDDVYLNEKMKKRDGSSGVKGFKLKPFQRAVLDYEGTASKDASSSPSLPEEYLTMMSGCNRDPPEDLVCPISLVLMTNDPVVAADGITYERASIEDWFEKSKSKGSVIHSPVQKWRV